MGEATTERKSILMYGAPWCPGCVRSKRFLGRHGVPYDWVNIEVVPGAAAVVQTLNGGKRIIPAIILPDGTILAEPSDRELGQALGLPTSN